MEVPFLPTIYPNTLVCYSYSKSLSLPGERIGYVCVPSCVEGQADVLHAVAGAARSPAMSARRRWCSWLSSGAPMPGRTWRPMMPTAACSIGS